MGPLATLALAGTILTGCSGPKEYRALTEEEIAEDRYSAVPINHFWAPEVGKGIGLPSELYMWDRDGDQEIDEIGFGATVYYVAEGSEWAEERVADGAVAISPEAISLATQIRRDNIRLNALLSAAYADQKSE